MSPAVTKTIPGNPEKTLELAGIFDDLPARAVNHGAAIAKHAVSPCERINSRRPDLLCRYAMHRATITPGEFRHRVGELALGEPIDALRLRLFSAAIGMTSQSAPRRCPPLGVACQSERPRAMWHACGQPVRGYPGNPKQQEIAHSLSACVVR